MRLVELLPEDRVVPSLRVGDKTQLLQELARRAAAASNLPQKQILAALEAREKLGSTGLGHGFALPHARVERLDRFFGLFARLARPIAWSNSTQNRVYLRRMFLNARGRVRKAQVAESMRVSAPYRIAINSIRDGNRRRLARAAGVED